MNWYKKAQEEKVMILVRCPPGGGKSTLAKQLTGNNGVVLESDEFFMQNGKYVFDKEKQAEAHNWNQDRCLEAMENGISPIVIANTNIQAIEAEPYVRMAIGHGYKIAMKDLEIRGAGNILGKQQSGSINRIGLNLYCQMISEAVEKFKPC